MKFLVLFTMVLRVLLGPMASAMAQSAPPGTSRTPTPAEAGLSDRTAAALRTVASSNLFEIESSKLALTRSQSAAVKEFADHMVRDHTRAANRMSQVLADLGGSPPAAMLDPTHQQQLDALKTVENSRFDGAFIEAQYVAHVEAISVIRDYAQTGDNEQLKTLAGQALPMLQSHLDQVTRLRDGAKPR